MSLNKREEKIYGAIHTQDHIVFEGFCKKIYSQEQYKVDVYIDDVLEETLYANKNLESIEDKYDMYDTNGFCFTYKIKEELIGEKHKIEFKTKDNTQLLKSPSQTLNPSHEEYNEIFFLRSLEEKIDEEKIKDLYKKDCIGFLASEENIEDIKFIEYLKELSKRFPHITLKAFYFSKKSHDLIKNLFINETNRLILVQASNIYEMAKEVEIFSINYRVQFNFPYNSYLPLVNLLTKYNKNIYISYYNGDSYVKNYLFDSDSSIKEGSIHYELLKDLKIKKDVIQENHYKLWQIIYNDFFTKNPSNEYVFNSRNNKFEVHYYDTINLILTNLKFKNHMIRIRKYLENKT